MLSLNDSHLNDSIRAYMPRVLAAGYARRGRIAKGRENLFRVYGCPLPKPSIREMPIARRWQAGRRR